jgi:hypothetical protein
MSDFPFGNDPAKIEGYRAFWERRPVDRPLVGFSFKSWFPLQEYAASSAWQSETHLTPDMIDPPEFMDDEERLLREGEAIGDDIFRGASPSQAVGWLGAMVGCPVRILPGSTLAEERGLSWDELLSINLDHDDPWFKTYMAFIDTLVARSGGRFPVSHGSLVGPSDLHAALRGHGQSIVDIIDEPERSTRLLWQLSDVFRTITEAAWQRIPLFHGGYYDAMYQLWAPGSIIRMQEDATALFSPRLYKTLLQPIDRDLAQSFECSFIHLHSTSMHILDLFLEIEEIRCYEINYEVSGPPLPDVLVDFRRVQEADRPLLIRGSFTPGEIDLVLDRLDCRGLYLYIMVESWEEIEALRPRLGM